MKEFLGFGEMDFAQIEGTHWRKDLGPDLIAIIGREYKAWPIYGWQGLHIGPEGDEQPEVEAAKFFLATDDERGGGLAYGLYIECAGRDEADRFVHWRNFRDGLSGDERMRATLATVLAKHDLTVGKYAGDDDHDPHWRFKHRDGRFRCLTGRTWKKASIAALVEKVAELPKDEWVDLYIYARMPKAKAIGLREDVSGVVGKVLFDLVPLYFQIISRRS
jgi:hypothetical protein